MIIVMMYYQQKTFKMTNRLLTGSDTILCWHAGSLCNYSHLHVRPN